MYHFSWLWFFVGLAVAALGLVWLRFYKEISDNMTFSYDRSKLIGLLLCGAGLIMMFNLHSLIFEFIARLIFGGMMKS